MLDAYFARLKVLLDRYAATPFVLLVRSDFETRPGGQGYLLGSVIFADTSTLYFSEFLDVTLNRVDKVMYSYHYQDAETHLVFRYDNARHKPPLTFIHHKHTPGEVTSASVPDLDNALTEISARRGWL